MTTTTNLSHEPQIPPEPQGLRPHWAEAWKALRDIVRDANDTARAIDFFYAVGPGSFERNFQRFATEPSGAKLLADRPSLGRILADRDYLASLPPDSLGCAYLEQMERNGLDPLGLIVLQAQVMRRWEEEFSAPKLDPTRIWFRDRYILMHDLFHVLSGYGTDELGEAALLWFSFAQQGGAWGVLGFGTLFPATRAVGPSWPAYAYRAWRRGRRACWLTALPFEELLVLPVTTVRRIARLDEPGAAHAGGVIVGDSTSGGSH